VPETTKNYQEKYPNNNFAFNPEFLTEKNANEDFIHADRIVLGGNEDALSTLSHLYREVGIFSETKIVRMSTTEAEIVKYHANVELATRVLVSNVIYDVCEKTGANYNKVREGVITDKRIGPSHSIVPGPDGSRGIGGKCFVKDLAALIGKAKDLNVDHKILEEFFLYNLRIREDRDWENIPGATSDGKKYD
jgi:UDPglucose 6-dehydrogenase